MTRRTSDDGASAEWIYDASPHGKGKLAAMVGPVDQNLNGQCQIPNATLTDGNRPGRWFNYSPNGDVLETFECTDGVTASSQFVYDNTTGRQSRVIYPDIAGARFAVDYNYSSYGPLWYVTDAADDTVLWAATAVNAAGQVTKEYTKNGIDTARVHGPATGWLLSTTSSSHAEGDKMIQDWSFDFDEAGNLRSRRRQDAVNLQPSTEWFGYDYLDRLTKARTKLDGQGAAAYDMTQSYIYDDLGNLGFKDGNFYNYTGCGGRPHAVCGVDGDGGATRIYDDNGNMTGGGGRTVTYNARNKPVRIVDSETSASADYVYDGDGNRVVQDATSITGEVLSTERTVYFGMGATGKSLYERTTKADGSFEHTQFIYAGEAHGGAAFAARVIRSSSYSGAVSAPETSYFHFDHLGSVTGISNDVGHVVDAVWGNSVDAGVMGYDAWGARRSPEGRPADPKSFSPQVGHREFTGHETIPHVGLVNMNGRVYDPVLGRFLSPDSTVQFVGNLQSYNRYSYVLNNPLSYTDPTGYHAVINKEVDGIVTGIAMAATLVACAWGGPVAEGVCYGLIIGGAAWNATTMKASGADWGDIVAIEGVGIIAGLATGGAAGSMQFSGTAAEQAGQMAIAKIAAGAISGAIVGAASTAVLGGDLGENVFMGAVQGYMGAMMDVAMSGGATAPVGGQTAPPKASDYGLSLGDFELRNPSMSRAEAAALFGKIDLTAANPWPKHEAWIVRWDVPKDVLFDKAYHMITESTGKPVTHLWVNSRLVPMLNMAFESLRENGLLGEMQTFDGSYVLRQTRGRHLISGHAYGIAVDFNATTNPLGGTPTMNQGVVRAFKGAGFVWGGEFSRPDGMHFSLGF